VAELGRVLDPEELAQAEGPRGRLVVDVPDAWRPGSTIELVVPVRLACARCLGGGCDDCGRSGAVRLPAEEAARTLRFALPEMADEARRVLRLVRPLGAEVGLEQLLVELRRAPSASPFARRLPGAGDRAPLAPALVVVAVLVVVALAAAAIASLR
jgi:hypothetical protein